MDLKKYRDKFGINGIRELAESSGAVYEYLYQIETGRANAGVKLVNKLVKASNGVLTREALRPDIFGDVS